MIWVGGDSSVVRKLTNKRGLEVFIILSHSQQRKDKTNDMLAWSLSLRLSESIHMSCISLKRINYETVAICK